MSNIDPTKYRERTQVLRKGKEILLHMLRPSCLRMIMVKYQEISYSMHKGWEEITTVQTDSKCSSHCTLRNGYPRTCDSCLDFLDRELILVIYLLKKWSIIFRPSLMVAFVNCLIVAQCAMWRTLRICLDYSHVAANEWNVYNRKVEFISFVVYICDRNWISSLIARQRSW
jgi:hypothetical protein